MKTAVHAPVVALLASCTQTSVAFDTGEDVRIELWQGGERVAWNTDSEAATLSDQIIAVEPEPFELWFAGCDLRVFATDDPATLDSVVLMEHLSFPDSDIDPGFTSFHGFNVGAANRDMDYLFLNDDEDPYRRISALHETFGARPVPGRPGWCRQPITQWWLDGGLYDVDQEPVSLLLWSDADGDWLDDEDERFRWTLEP